MSRFREELDEDILFLKPFLIDNFNFKILVSFKLPLLRSPIGQKMTHISS